MKRLLPCRSQSKPQFMETLETRRHLSAARVTSVSADNRGEVILSLNAALNAATVTKSSVQAYTAGADGVQGTSDDAHLPASVRYSSSLNRITINAQVAANVGYRVRLVSPRIRDTAGNNLDGEFNGAGLSGNGRAGGIFEFQTRNDRSSTPTVKMSTSAGTITVRVFRSLKPINANAFLGYVNSGGYDGMFISRSVPGFVLQGGGSRVNANNQIEKSNANDPTIANEFATNGVIHNTAYTLAFAKASNNPNPPSREFFFSIGDNSTSGSQPDNLDEQNGGFTVFATANNPTSIATLNTIAAKPRLYVNGSPAPINDTYNGTADPKNDLVVFRRAAVVVEAVKV